MLKKDKIKILHNLENLSNELASEIESFTNEQLHNDVKASGLDAKQLIIETRELLLNTEKMVRQKKLESSKQEYQSRSNSFANKLGSLPSSPGERKKLFEKLLSLLPTIDPNFALQFRDYKTMSDDDILSVLLQAQALGFLKDIE